MMSPAPCLKLNSGHQIPQLGFGTFNPYPENVDEAVEVAIDVGYRHIDCAMIYGNEKEVGEGIARSLKKHNLKREDLFITSKLWCDKHAPEDVPKACEQSIRDLGVNYLDLYLIHYPVSFHEKEGVPYDLDDPATVVYEHRKLEDTWKAMEGLVSAGLVKSIGVSNFNRRQVERILQSCSIAPAVNQVEVNLHWLNTKLIEYCHAKDIQVEAYSPFCCPGLVQGAVRPLLEDPTVAAIARRHKRTPAQVILRHALQRGLVVLTANLVPEFIRSNFDVFGFVLTEDEMQQLNSVGSNRRVLPFLVASKHPEYPFLEEP